MNKNYTYIQRVAEYGGLTQAAEELYISTPALSKFIKNRENELGIKIFDREGKTFKLTYAGQRYLEFEEQVQELKRNFENEIQNKNLSPNTTLRIGFPLSVAKIIITKVMPKFQKRYPNVTLIVHEDKVVNLNKLLLAKKLDLIITMKPVENRDYISTYPVASGQIALIGPSKLNLNIDAKYRPSFSYPWIESEKIKKMPIIGLREHSFYREYIKKYMLDELNAEPNIKVTLSTIEHVLLAVKSNLGLTPMFDILVKISGYKNLSFYSFGRKPQIITLQIACQRDILSSSANLDLIDMCRSKIRKEVN